MNAASPSSKLSSRYFLQLFLKKSYLKHCRRLQNGRRHSSPQSLPGRTVGRPASAQRQDKSRSRNRMCLSETSLSFAPPRAVLVMDASHFLLMLVTRKHCMTECCTRLQHANILTGKPMVTAASLSHAFLSLAFRSFILSALEVDFFPPQSFAPIYRQKKLY